MEKAGRHKMIPLAKLSRSEQAQLKQWNVWTKEAAVKSGVPWLVKKMIKGKMTSGTRTFTDLGNGKYRMNVTNTPKGDIEYTFSLGETFEAMGPDGKPHKITFSVSGDRLNEHHEHIEGNRKGDVDITEFFIENGYVIAAMAAKEVVWKRYYKKD